MTFVAQIKADASGFSTTVDQAADKLTGLERKGTQAGDALTRSFRGVAEAMRWEGLQAGAKAFDGLTAAIRREQDMLEKINGPMQRYEQSLQTLDALLNKDKISTEQYAEQVRRLNQELERGSTIKMTTAAPTDWTANIKEFRGIGAEGGGGESGNMLSKLGTKVGGLGGAGLLMAGGEAFAAVEAVKEYAELADEYTNIGNKLQVVAADQDDLNKLMGQTRDIANDTRMSWEATVSTYQRLKNVTGDLGLSEQQVLDLTKQINEAAKISGASQYESQMATMELTHAFAMGSLQGRQFMVLLRDMPAMMHELQMASGMTQAEFAELGHQGKITAQDLVQWFGAAAPSIQHKFEKTKSTVGEFWTHVKNDGEAAVGYVGDQFDKIGHGGVVAFHAIDDAWSHYVTHVKSSADYQAIIDASREETEKLTLATSQMNAAVKKIDDELRAGRQTTLDYYGVIRGTVENIQHGASATQALGDAFSYLDRNLARLLNDQQAANTILDTATQQMKALQQSAGVAADVVYKLEDAMSKVRPLDVTTLSGPQQNAYLQARIDQIKAEDAAKGYGEATDEVRIAELKRSVAIQQLSAAMRGSAISAEAYEHAIKGLQDPVDKATKQTHKLSAEEQEEKRILEDLNGARDKFNLGMEAAFDLYAHGTISLKQYRQELEKLQADWNKAQPAPESVIAGMQAEGGFQFNGPQVGPGPASLPGVPAQQQNPKNLTEQWRHELSALESQAKKTAAVLTKVFDPIEQGIVDLFKTGTLNIQQITGQVLDDIAQMLLKMGEMKLVSALAPVLHFATGGDVTIPHAANGLSGTFGGSGGTDSQLFMARVTPGEHVSIRTPEQMAAQQQQQAARPVQVVVHDGGDPRAITAAFASPDFERQVIRVMRKAGRN